MWTPRLQKRSCSYEELFEKTNESFWNSLSSCYRMHLQTSKARRQEPKSITEDNFGCDPFYRAYPALHDFNYTILASLSEYDIFVIEKVISIDENWVIDPKYTKLCLKSYNYKQFLYSNRFCQFHYAARNYDYLTQYCLNGTRCDADLIDNDLANLVSKIHFLMNGLVLF